MTGPPTLYGYHPYENACHYHRIACPARHAGVPGRVRFGPDLPPAGGRHAAVLLHGLFDPEPFAPEFLRWKVRGKRFVWGVDDDYPRVPDWSEARVPPGMLEFRQWAIAAADFVFCSTPHLAGTLDGRTQNVRVLPNLIDLAAYPDPARTAAARSARRGRVRVLWQGSRTHRDDLRRAERAVLAVLDAAPGTEVCFWGDNPPPAVAERGAYRGVRVLDPVPLYDFFREYEAAAPDVVICPLADVPFNASKSGLKVKEAWSAGAAVVASAVGPYAALVRHGEDGLLAATPEEFEHHLVAAVRDAALRDRLAAAGRRRVEAEWSWQHGPGKALWDEAVAEVLA